MLTIVYGEERGMWCPSTVARDNWVRLVAAVVKKEQIWKLCHQQSISTISSHDSTQPSLSYSVPPLPFKNPSLSRGKLFPGWFGRRKYVDKDLVDIPEDIAIHLGQLQRFQIQELLVATDSFNSRNNLGKGGYGNVYKGRLADGTLIAVEWRREMIAFQTEVEVMSSVAVHRNLQRPRGFCMSTMGCLLVYPYLPNGSVLSCLRERRESEAPLSWTIRKRIALGVARGVVYLHEELGDFKIIHRNISAEKIFLDEDFEAVVGDFSLAVLVEQNDTYVGNTGRGTTGLISPEYVATGGVSEKSDVYGYGVFLLELISERKAWTLAQLAKDEDLMLLDWIHRLYKGKKWEKIVGANNYIEDAVMKQLLQIALLCTEINPKKRPKMSEVVSMIEDSDCSSPRMVEP